MKPVIAVINGPSLNRLGTREPEIYGYTTLAQIIQGLELEFPHVTFTHTQTNHEGAIIDALFEAQDNPDVIGIILNAGAYTHTSLAISDAIAAISKPVIEVHLSNIFAREPIRHISLISGVCAGSICGLGPQSYNLAARYLMTQSS
ncbi:MAG: 3-dehydroquinate dehydratase [Muribaculaceae bacterium]|nr:3-dehydroquinate dehydratase [Muribaculaceae bacterium]